MNARYCPFCDLMLTEEQQADRDANGCGRRCLTEAENTRETR